MLNAEKVFNKHKMKKTFNKKAKENLITNELTNILCL